MDTLKQIAKGTLADTQGTLYTTPAGTTAIVRSIIIANPTSTDEQATVMFDGVNIVPGHTVPANDTLTLDLTSVLEENMLIEGSASTASSLDYYISGIEVTT
jgi:hypothetical protein